jgi:hypothetical protein
MTANEKTSQGIKLLVALTVLAALFTAQPGAAAGRSRYVSLNGNNANRGSIDQPWETIAYAASQLQPGDTLYLRGGTYPVSTGDFYYVETRTSGTADSPIIITAYSGEKVIIDGSGVSQNFMRINHDYWVVENLELTNFSQGTDLFTVDGSFNTLRGLTIHDIAGGAVGLNGSSNVLEGSTIHDLTRRAGAVTVTGVKIGSHNEGACDNNIVRNNNIYNNPTGELVYIGAEGSTENVACQNNQILYNELHDGSEAIQIKLRSTGNLIKSNHIYNISIRAILSVEGSIIAGNTIHSPLSPEAAITLRRNNQAINNLIYNTDGTGTGIVVTPNTDVALNNEPMGFGNKLYNNTVLGLAYGIQFNNAELLHDNVFINNLSAFNKEMQIDPARLDGSNIFDYNNWFGPKSSQPGDGPNTRRVDPGLIDQNNQNYRISASSPLVDKGMDLRSEGVATDIEGRARPQGAGFDVGAYEYSEGGINPPSLMVPFIIR